MPHINAARRGAVIAAALLTLLAGLALTACGSASKGASSTAATAAANAANAGRGRFGARAASLRACLAKNGVTLPKRNPGQRRGSGEGGPFGAGGQSGRGGPGAGGNGPAGGAQLPKGVTRAQLQAAFEKCGGGRLRRRGAISSASGRQRFAKFAACMRADGVELPTPNTSGKGPIFNTKGIDTNSSKFKAADAKCAHELAPAGGDSGGPPAGGGFPGASAPPGARGAPGAARP